MDLIQSKLRDVYLKYLAAALGSTLILTIYSSVDMIAVGQYAGPTGTAALTCVTPLWSIVIGLGVLLGIGGSVRMSLARGEGNEDEAHRWFTLTMVVTAVAMVLATAGFFLFLDPMLLFFGADEALLPHCREYAQWLCWAAPVFLLGPVLSSFIRNDGAPFLCTLAVVCGGVFNIFGDWFFTFVLDMGLSGAGLATALGQYLSAFILLSYFLRRGKGLRLARPDRVGYRLAQIGSTGFAPFVVEVSFGITVILFNRQIMALAGADELAVFGAVVNCAILFQSLFNGVGQAVQPIVSPNFGAGRGDRVRETCKLALVTAAIMGVLFFALAELLPGGILRLYMDVTPSVMAIGPGILRIYGSSFLLMGINVVASYYLQSLVRTVPSVAISLARGVALPAVLLFLLPAAFSFSAIWWTMPLTELLTALLAVWFLRRNRIG